jgi:hypothetical protein
MGGMTASLVSSAGKTAIHMQRIEIDPPPLTLYKKNQLKMDQRPMC